MSYRSVRDPDSYASYEASRDDAADDKFHQYMDENPRCHLCQHVIIQSTQSIDWFKGKPFCRSCMSIIYLNMDAILSGGIAKMEEIINDARKSRKDQEDENKRKREESGEGN